MKRVILLVIICGFGVGLTSSCGKRAAVENAPSHDGSPSNDPVTKTSFLYVSLQASGKVAAYSKTGDSNDLVAVPGSPFTSAPGTYGLVVDPSNHFLYATNYQDVANVVTVFSIDPKSGALSLVGKFGTGRGPVGMAFHPSGHFLYVTNWRGTGTVSAYAVDSEKGILRELAASPFRVGSAPRGIAVDPGGEFLFVANSGADSLSGFKIDSSTGNLTPVAGTPFVGNGLKSPDGLAVSSNGKFLYSGNESQTDEWISGFEIESVTGSLTPISGSPFVLKGISPCRGGCGFGFFGELPDFFIIESGSNSIGLGTADLERGFLSFGLRVPAGLAGATFPNDFKMDPSGKVATVVHSKKNTISVFQISSPVSAGLTLMNTVKIESAHAVDAGTMAWTH